MITVTTTYTTTATGAGRIVAKAQGKQRTVTYDPALSVKANHGGAAGTLLNVLLDARTQAMLRHPAGHNLITHMGFDNGVHKFNVEV